MDGRRVDRLGQLQRLIAQKDPGDTIHLSLIRFGEPISASVRLGEARIAATEQPRSRPGATFVDLGLDLTDLDEPTARTMGFGNPGGVLIADVQPYGPAFRKNISPGVRLISIGNERVTSARQARSLLRAIAGGAIASLVLEAPDGRFYIANVRVP
jgi:serine protease Do